MVCETRLHLWPYGNLMTIDIAQPPGMLREREVWCAISKTKCWKDWAIEWLKTHSIYNLNFSKHSVSVRSVWTAETGWFFSVQFLHFHFKWIELNFYLEKKGPPFIGSCRPSAPKKNRLPNQKLYFLDYLHSLMKLCPGLNDEPDQKIEMSNIHILIWSWLWQQMTKAIQLCGSDAAVHIFGKLPFFPQQSRLSITMSCVCVFSSCWWTIAVHAIAASTTTACVWASAVMAHKRNATQRSAKPLKFDWAFIWQIKTYFFCSIFEVFYTVYSAQVCVFLHGKMTFIGSFWFTILFIYLFSFCRWLRKMGPLHANKSTAESVREGERENLRTSIR